MFIKNKNECQKSFSLPDANSSRVPSGDWDTSQ